MRKLLYDMNATGEMTKKDIIETILFILSKILTYTSKLNEAIPSVFDKKEKEEKNIQADLSTDDCSEKEDNICLEENSSFTEDIYYWVEKLNYSENLLFLMMMNLDKILKTNKVILNEKNIDNILFTCMIITQKYYEDEIFSDKDYSRLKNIECDALIKMQIDFLEAIDYSLLISKDELDQYKIRMKNLWKKNMLFLINS